MKTAPIVPATLAPAPASHRPHEARGGTPYSPLFDDVYHAAAGAFEQAEHVFLRGNNLPDRWQSRSRFVILETGFGLGNNFLATWAAWQRDPQRCDRLIFVSIEKHPLTRDDLAQVHASSAQPDLAQQLVARWPPLTPNLHTLVFEGGRVQLILALGDIASLLPALVAEVDAFYLDGFAPAKNPEMWDEHLLKRLGRLAAAGATAATWSIARGVRDGLTQAGFDVQRAPGFAGKRDMLTARHAPRHIAARPCGAPRTPRCEPRALIIGGGLAGCAAAWGLAEQGWSATVLDRHADPASEASGNPAGLFHGIINRDDGPHARLHRAAALCLAQLVRLWIDQGRLPGQCQGLLRLEPRLSDSEAQAWLGHLGLPASYVNWLDRTAAQARTGLPVPSGGWWFGDGGWLQPGALARLLLAESKADWVGSQAVARLSREDGLWHAWNAAGELIARAPVAVIAGGTHTGDLLPMPPATPLAMSPVRGQVSWLAGKHPAIRPPLVPVAGSGYVIPCRDGRLVFGATAQHHDPAPEVRVADHARNIQQAQALGALDRVESRAETDTKLDAYGPLEGRVGWRAVTPDRLPIIGPAALAVDPSGATAGATQARHHPKWHDDAGGLYLMSGLGSRGITWSALAGRCLAAWVTGGPAPVESDLLYAMDPARWVLKTRR